MADNPYLAHLAPSARGSNGTPLGSKVAEPLFGFVPRHVAYDKVLKAMVSIALLAEPVIIY